MQARTLRWFLALAALALVAPAGAAATTAAVQAGVIVVDDAQGIDDVISIEDAGSNEQGRTIGIAGATPLPGGGCRQGAGRALCPDGTGSDGTGAPHAMSLTLGDGDDRLTVSRGIDTGLQAPDFTVDTGAGEDRVEARSGGQFLIATGPEDDTVILRGTGAAIEPAAIDAGAGNDRIDLAGHPTDPDTADGGTGAADHVTYAGRTAGVTIVSDPAQGSGQAGENDRLSNFERLEGGSGSDTILGGPGRDTLIGGPGLNDVLRGFGGADTLNTNDGLADARADCGFDPGFGGGNDLAIIDLPDPHPNFVTSGGFTRPVNGGPANCETVMEQPVDEAPVALLKRARAVRGAVLVRVRCTRPAGCRGTLRVTDKRLRPVSAARRLRLAAGRSRTIRIPLRVRTAPAGASVVARGRDETGRPLTASLAVRAKRPRGA